MEKLKEIINNSNEGQDMTLEFEEYLKNIKKVPYSKKEWSASWRRGIYNLGSLFSKIDATPYLKILYKQKESCADKEIFDFIYSEIIWNLFEQNNDYIKDEFRELIKKYPTNPEFHHSYSHYLTNNENYEQAIFEAKTAYKFEPENIIFINSYIIKTKNFFDFLLLKSRLEDAEKLLSKCQEFVKGLSGTVQWEMMNRLYSMKDRLHDYQALENKVNFFEKNIENTIKIEQRKLIEILGIFSAIIAFILTNITIIIGNLTPKQILYLMLGMALVLIIFAVTISFLFGPRYRYADWKWFISRPKLWVIIALLILLGGMIYLCDIFI